MHNPAGIRSYNYRQDSAIIRTKWQWFLLAAALVAIVGVVPFTFSSYALYLAVKWGILIIAALGLNILVGRTGLISIAHAAFVAVGGYTSALVVTKLSLPFLVAVPCAGLMAGLIGILFGLPSLRIRGLYLLAATLAAQFIIAYVINNLTSVTGGYAGIVVPHASIGGFVLDDNRKFYFLLVPVLILMTILATNLNRNRLGRAFIAIRSNDKVAEGLGVNLWKYKLLSFFIACFFAGVAGSLWAHWQAGIMTMEGFTLWSSIWYFGYIIVGGLGSVVGVFAGVLFVEGAREILNSIINNIGTGHPDILAKIAPSGDILFGVILIVFLIWEARGISHRWEILKSYYRLWPFSYSL